MKNFDGWRDEIACNGQTGYPIVVGTDKYPEPIVDHKEAHERYLAVIRRSI
jgi:deoxyribodipyrimidine photolyase